MVWKAPERETKTGDRPQSWMGAQEATGGKSRAREDNVRDAGYAVCRERTNRLNQVANWSVKNKG